jgi:hypothetical protein
VDRGLHPLLPCARCRVLERAADELKGWKPGRHQAEALLEAAPARGGRDWPYPRPGTAFDPEATDPAITRSEKENLYQAVRALRDRGLIYAIPPRNRSKRRKGTLWRTPLGQAVVDQLEDHLRRRRTGARVPFAWDREALKAARLPTDRLKGIFKAREERVSDDLHEEFETQVTDVMTDDDWLNLAAQKATLLLAADEVDERHTRRIVARWTPRGTRAEVVARARTRLPGGRHLATLTPWQPSQ